MASRAEQKAAARAAREITQRQLKSAADKRRRLIMLGGMLAVLIVAAVVVVVANSSGGSGTNNATNVSKTAQTTVQQTVAAELAGIHQAGNVLGNPSAKVTITEYGDLVCSTCASFAVTTEPQVISTWVKAGIAKLVFRAFDTASSYANQSQFVNTQVAVRSAGLQGKEWQYILTVYEEQPVSINGTSAENTTYVNLPYLQSRASQIPGLNLAKWQAHMSDQTLINQVTTDNQAAVATHASGSPAIVVSGPKGSQLDTTDPGVPQIATLQSLISQVS